MVIRPTSKSRDRKVEIFMKSYKQQFWLKNRFLDWITQNNLEQNKLTNEKKTKFWAIYPTSASSGCACAPWRGQDWTPCFKRLVADYLVIGVRTALLHHPHPPTPIESMGGSLRFFSTRTPIEHTFQVFPCFFFSFSNRKIDFSKTKSIFR